MIRDISTIIARNFSGNSWAVRGIDERDDGFYVIQTVADLDSISAVEIDGILECSSSKNLAEFMAKAASYSLSYSSSMDSLAQRCSLFLASWLLVSHSSSADIFLGPFSSFEEAKAKLIS